MKQSKYKVIIVLVLFLYLNGISKLCDEHCSEEKINVTQQKLQPLLCKIEQVPTVILTAGICANGGHSGEEELILTGLFATGHITRT